MGKCDRETEPSFWPRTVPETKVIFFPVRRYSSNIGKGHHQKDFSSICWAAKEGKELSIHVVLQKEGPYWTSRQSDICIKVLSLPSLLVFRVNLWSRKLVPCPRIRYYVSRSFDLKCYCDNRTAMQDIFVCAGFSRRRDCLLPFVKENCAHGIFPKEKCVCTVIWTWVIWRRD